MELITLIERLFAEYGYGVLLLGLPLDAIALPIPPGNLTLTYTGYLASRGVLHWLWALLAAYGGAVLGITITYALGRKLGRSLLLRVGPWLGLNPRRWQRLQQLYARYGNMFLVLSFFLPGLRQVNGYGVGMMRVPWTQFWHYAYLGAALWVGCFFSLGFFFAEQWTDVLRWVERYSLYVAIAGVVLLIGLFMRKGWLRWRDAVQRRGAVQKYVEKDDYLVEMEKTDHN